MTHSVAPPMFRVELAREGRLLAEFDVRAGFGPTVECATALFASDLQPSQRPSAREVRDAVRTVVARHDPGGCAAIVANAYGNEPDLAMRRMTWALAQVTAAIG
jgi:hypothetical protein